MFRFVLPLNSLLTRLPRQLLVLVYMERLWEDKLELCTKEMVETASKSSKQHIF